MFIDRSKIQAIPPVTLNLIIINFLFYLATLVLRQSDIDLISILGLHYFESSKFNLIQLISYMFLHANFSHIFFNMFSLFMFGRMLEQIMGAQRYLTYYFITGIGAALVQECVWWFQIRDILSHSSFNLGNNLIVSQSEFMINYLPELMNNFITVGASGAIFGILLAFGLIFPNVDLYLMFIPVPIRAKYFVLFYGIIELFLGVANFSSDPIAHFAHLGGMIFGYLIIRYWKNQDRKNGKYFF